MRLIIDHASGSSVQFALQTLEKASIPIEGGGTVRNGNEVSGVILIAALQCERAIDVLRVAGIVVRPG